MADSDYTTRGVGPITPHAFLTGPIDPSVDAPFTIRNFSSPTGAMPAVGCAVMVGQEIMRLLTITETTMTCARGCADTIPQYHLAGDIAWFLDNAVGGDGREYMGSETIGVKLLMRTNGAAMPLKSSPPNALTFNTRFDRPYPPGQVKVGSAQWFRQRFLLDLDHPSANITWVHRDRVTQDDQLYGHEVGPIGPEVGVTYRLRFYTAGNVLKGTANVPTGSNYNMSLSTLMGMYGLSSGQPAVDGYVLLTAVRESFESLQPYRIELRINPNASEGWGANWGFDWGGA